MLAHPLDAPALMSATAAEPKRCGHNNNHRGRRRRRRETREKRKRGHSFVMHPLRLRGSQARADAKTPRGQSLLLEAGAARPRHASAPRPALQETESPLLRPSVPRGRETGPPLLLRPSVPRDSTMPHSTRSTREARVKAEARRSSGLGPKMLEKKIEKLGNMLEALGGLAP